MSKIKHPTQPLYYDDHGTLRFKGNTIIEYLFKARLLDLNQIAVMNFPKEDHVQLAQLLGYSLSGFGDLSYVSDKVYEAAAATAPKKGKK